VVVVLLDGVVGIVAMTAFYLLTRTRRFKVENLSAGSYGFSDQNSHLHPLTIKEFEKSAKSANKLNSYVFGVLK